MKKMFFLFALTLSIATLNAQTAKVVSYIKRHATIAKAEMCRTGIPASITLAQGMLESDRGSSPLAQKKHNHFGVKNKNGHGYKTYSSLVQSFIDHSKILKHNKCYASLFRLKKTDYKSWAIGLYKCGYASDPHYARKLIRYIEQYNLDQYDQEVMREIAYASL